MAESNALAVAYIVCQSVMLFVVSIVSLFAVNHTYHDQGCKKMMKLWLKTAWKMRGVYTSFFVHCFDITTDLLVISEWYNAETPNDNRVEHIDSQLMAWCSVSVIIFHAIISAVAVFLTSKSYIRCILQLFGLLLFEEIFLSHQEVVSSIVDFKLKSVSFLELELNIKHGSDTQGEYKQKDSERTVTDGIDVQDKNKDKDENKIAIDTSVRFKYIRSLEALYESTPQVRINLYIHF